MSILKIKDNHGVWHIIKALKGKDGINLEFEWNGTKLGVKTSEEKEFKYVDLKGETGQTGATGMTGNSIKSIEKLSTKDNVDTYAVNFTDGTQTTFNVTNGEVSLDELKEVDNKVESNYEEFENLKSELLATNEVRNSFINVGDSYKEQLLNLSIDGVLKQNTTTGKNLLDYVNNIISSGNGLTSVINEDGSITTVGIPTGNYTLITKKMNITNLLEDQSIYTISQNDLNNKMYIQLNAMKVDGTFTYIHLGDKNVKSKSFKVDKTTYSNYTIVIQTCKSEYWGDSSLTITNKYMLCKGTDTADTSFEPYTGSEPSPSPNYPQKIKTLTGNIKLTSCGKNLFDIDNVNNLPTNSSVIKNTDQSVTYKIDSVGTWWNAVNYRVDNIKPETKYTFQFNVNNISISKGKKSRILIDQMSNDNKVISVSNPRFIDVSSTGLYNLTFKSEKNTSYFIIRIYVEYNASTANTYITLSNVMLEQNSSITSYEEYVSSKIEVNIPKNEFIGKINDTYKDELVAVYNQEDCKYHLILNKMIGKKLIDGNTGNIAKTGDNCFGINDAIKNFLQFSDFTIDNNKNNKYIILAQTSSNSQFFSISKDYNYAMNFTSTEKFNNIRIKDIKLNTVDELKQSLNEKPMEVYYILNLNSRYSLDLGSIDMLKTYEGVTNIFTDSDLLPSIQIKYYKNFKETIKELKINEKSLKDELQSLSERLSALETKQVVSSDDSNVENEVIS